MNEPDLISRCQRCGEFMGHGHTCSDLPQPERPLTDQELADQIRAKCTELAALTAEMSDRGIRVDFDVIPRSRIDREYDAYLIEAKIERPQKL